MEVILFAIVPLAVLIGSILGLVAFLKVKDLQSRLHDVERKLSRLSTQPGADTAAKVLAEVSTASRSAMSSSTTATPPVSTETSVDLKSAAAADWYKETITEDLSDVTYPAEDESLLSAKPAIDWVALIQQYWMVILGGVCLVFAGVFLVRYSIEHGMLGPAARTTLGLIFGAVLIAAGEKLRRSGRLEAGVHAAFVAAGSLVVYSALLVGYHVYELFSAQTAFAGMALMSAFSMLLALKHGPLMAGMGLLGAYLVPILVSTGSKNIEAALLYSFIVTCGSFWLQRYIYRSWLWWGTWLGAIGWFVLSLDLPGQAQGMRALYIAALGYAGVSFAFAGLKLRLIDVQEFPGRKVFEQISGVFLALSVALMGLLHVESLNEMSYPAVTLLPIVAALVARNNLPALRLLPLMTLSPILVELFAMDISFGDWKITIQPLPETLQSAYIIMLVIVTAVFASIAGREIFKGRHAGYWSSFILFMPLVAIILAYLRVSGMQDGLAWALPTFLIGGTYGYLLTLWRNRKQVVEVEAALAIASQFAIATASFFAFSEVTLTLILAVQLVGLAYIDRKIQVAVLPLIMKIMLLLVIVRLTLNPWVAFYAVSSFTLLLTYAGCLAACVVAAREVRDRPALTVWLYSASAHLLVLTLAVFTRYLLYGGDIFAKEFTLTESSIYLCSWAAIGILYEWKSSHLENFRRWYRGMAMLHIFAAAALYVFYNFMEHNPLWSAEGIGSTPVFNLLLIAYGLPVLLAAIIYRRIAELKQFAGVISMAALYLFVTLEIRHLWNDGIRLHMPVKEGELYTYSLVWLVISIAIMLYGAYRNNREAKKAGVLALLVVIAKVFLWDMRDLDGLWRVVSFLGLGLSLLGIAYLFNKFKAVEKA